jgi:heme/copper-type cytochrome/quinol oxidase subunit 2
MLDTNTYIIILCTIIIILLGVNLYFNWKYNKDANNNETILGMNSKQFKHYLNIFSAFIIFIMWVCCLIFFTSKKLCKGVNTPITNEGTSESINEGINET